jgi:Domain of unknown function (DUF5664)
MSNLPMKCSKNTASLEEVLAMIDNPPQKAVRSDAGKARMELLSSTALKGTAAVLEFGSRKYQADNWRKGMEWRRCIGSLMRHLAAFNDGEDLDPESGLPHVDHIACNAMFLQEYFRTHKELDDRYKGDNKT